MVMEQGPCTYQDDGIYTVTVRVTDSDTGLGIDTVAVTVNNLAPSIGSISSVNPVLPGVQINVSSSFSDAGVLDSHTATWDWGDSNSSTGVVSETNGSGIVTGSHTYSSPGVYTATLTVDDGTDSNSQTFSVIILTPSEAINNLVDLVETFNLQQGINNSLDAKLDAALNALDDVNENNDQAAINSLYAFINSVEAQRGNQITNSQADQLVAAAQAIIVYLSS
jgi:PKD repeat protein